MMMYGTTQENPDNLKDFMYLYVTMIKHLVGSNIITSKRQRNKKKERETIYELNIKKIKEYVELDKISNEFLTNYDEEILKELGIEKPKKSKKDSYDIDDLLDI